MKQITKCFSVNLTQDQAAVLKETKEKSGKTQGQVLTEAVGSGLQQLSHGISNKKLYLVKVRINIDFMAELGQKLQTGELDTSMILFTYCLKDDPAVGVSLWKADDKDHFDKLFGPHKKYYKELIDIHEVVMPEESMKLLCASQ